VQSVYVMFSHNFARCDCEFSKYH